MTTLTKEAPAARAISRPQSETVVRSSRYERWIESIKFNHFFIISFTLLSGSCLGSIAAMSVFYNNGPTWMFGIGLFATMANLVAAIAQAPTKWVINLFIVSVVVNIALIAANLIL